MTVLGITPHDVKLNASDAVVLTRMMLCHKSVNNCTHGSVWLLITPVLGVYKEYGLLTCPACT